jgi:hypothetical protein
MLPAMYTDESGSDNDDYSNSDDEETEVYEQKVQEGIQNGVLVVKNPDDTYKCPLSPGKKKQSYKYRELLAHATTIASGKKGPEKYLQAELGDKPMIPQAERVLYLEQTVPKREVVTRLLAPWMGILVNIDNSRTNDKGFRLAAGAADIKEKFKVNCASQIFNGSENLHFPKGVWCLKCNLYFEFSCVHGLLALSSLLLSIVLPRWKCYYFGWLYILNSNFHLSFWLFGESGV